MTNPANTWASVRLLLVDSHKAFRQRLATILTNEGFSIVGEAGTGEEGVRLARSTQPDIVLMDVYVTGMDGVRATAELLKVSTKSQVVGLSLCDGNTMLRMMKAGASVFVPKTKLGSFLNVLHGMAEVLTTRTGEQPQAIADVKGLQSP